jgi:glycosyltransferase involved in cell wall biosynthesis
MLKDGQVLPMRIGYVLSVFPKLSESFILNEITELLNHEVDIQIFSVSFTNEDILHDKYWNFNLANRSFYFNKCACTSLKMLPLLSTALRYLVHPPLIQNPMSKLRCLAVTSQFREIAQKLNIDVFHAHFASETAVIAMYLSEDLKVPFTFTAHAFDLYRGTNTALWPVKRQLLRKLCKEATGIVTISNYNRDFLIKIGIDRAKISVIHCGIDPNKFKRTTPYRISKRILCVARLVEKKGIRYLIEAMGLLGKRHPDVKLTIVGTGPEEKTLKKLVNNLKVKDRIQFLGNIHDVDLLNLYEKSSIFVLPCIVAKDGDRDGIPVALMEAMSMELPVISTPISGIPELIEDGENGLLVEPKNPVALAEAIEQLLGKPETCKRLGEQGRKTILEQFNIKKNVLSLKKFFQTQLASKL